MTHTETAKIIANNNGRLYYVGGCVRDRIMERKSKDIDFCVTGISVEKFQELFPSSFIIGSSFPVFQFEGCEFAFARKERKTSLGHKGFETDYGNISIEDDLFRRDVTINSIAIDVLTDEIIDPFNGIQDINNKLLKATSNHFVEDPLRVYRVVQFATRFEFTIDEDTKQLMSSMKLELSSLSAERVFTELCKALEADKPSTFFNILKELNLLEVHFKEINDLIDVIQPIEYHPEGDAYTHSLIVLDKVSGKTQNISARFSALIHDIGKGITPKDILPHHYNHDENGIIPAKELCKRLKVPANWQKLAIVIVSEHMKAGIFEKMNDGSKVAFLERNYKYLNELELVAQIDSNNPNLYFAKLGKELISFVNGKTEKLPNNKHAKEILHAKRVEKLKQLFN